MAEILRYWWHNKGITVCIVHLHDDVIKRKHFPRPCPFCAGNSLVTSEFPSQRPVTQSFDAFFDLRLNRQLSEQLRGWWSETQSRPLWRHCNVPDLDCKKLDSLETIQVFRMLMKYANTEYCQRIKWLPWSIQPFIAFHDKISEAESHVIYCAWLANCVWVLAWPELGIGLIYLVENRNYVNLLDILAKLVLHHVLSSSMVYSIFCSSKFGAHSFDMAMLFFLVNSCDRFTGTRVIQGRFISIGRVVWLLQSLKWRHN